MSDTYSEDVMKAARDAVADAYLALDIPRMAGLFRAGEYDGTVDVQAAARAILAERERAAKKADAMQAKIDARLRKLEKPNADLAGAAAVGAADAAQKIAAAIRKGDIS